MQYQHIIIKCCGAAYLLCDAAIYGIMRCRVEKHLTPYNWRFNNRMFHKVATFLVIVGAANIGLTSWLHFDLIAVFGALSSTINVLVGVSGIYMLISTYTTLLKKA